MLCRAEAFLRVSTNLLEQKLAITKLNSLNEILKQLWKCGTNLS